MNKPSQSIYLLNADLVDLVVHVKTRQIYPIALDHINELVDPKQCEVIMIGQMSGQNSAAYTRCRIRRQEVSVTRPKSSQLTWHPL